jgi:hypothetical protein
MFGKFHLLKNHKIADYSTTAAEARKKAQIWNPRNLEFH